MCLELATVVGDFMKRDITIVGGLVPPLLVPHESLPEGSEAHPGTMDVDVALSLALLDKERYKALSARLREAGLEPDETEEGNPTRQRWRATAADGESITIEFLIAPSRPDDEAGKLRNLEQDFAAWIMEGMGLAFEDRDIVTLSGTTLRGEKVGPRQVATCGPGAFVVLKALAFHNRGLNKDAYDLYYVIRNYERGIEAVAARLRPLLHDAVARRAVAFLRNDFETIDHVGPRRAAAFLDREDDEDLRADVRGFVIELAEACGDS